MERPICIDCNKNLAKPTGLPKPDGSRYYSERCMGCINQKNHGKRRGARKPWQKNAKTAYKKHKKDHCEECGFKAAHPMQLEVDHMDGDHSNNELSNLKTMCANCHRLKTALAKEYISKQWRQK